jgi:hypothetical protein
MSGAPRAILVAILRAIDDLEAGRSSIAEVQQQLEANALTLDRSAGDLVQALRAVDADLEEIRFAMLLDEQHPAAVFRLDPVRAMVAAELGRAGD